MEIATVFWGADGCTNCGRDVREITLVETVDGELVRSVLLECSDGECVSHAWAFAPALAA